MDGPLKLHYNNTQNSLAFFVQEQSLDNIKRTTIYKLCLSFVLCTMIVGPAG